MGKRSLWWICVILCQHILCNIVMILAWRWPGFPRKIKKENTVTLAVPSSFYAKATEKAPSCTFAFLFSPPHLCFQSDRSLKLFASWGEAQPCERASFLIHRKIWFCFLSFLNFSCTLLYFSHADDGWASESRSCCGYRVHMWGSL